MGMSDLQFKSFIRELIANLEKAKGSEEEVEELIKRLKQTLED